MPPTPSSAPAACRESPGSSSVRPPAPTSSTGHRARRSPPRLRGRRRRGDAIRKLTTKCSLDMSWPVVDRRRPLTPTPPADTHATRRRRRRPLTPTPPADADVATRGGGSGLKAWGRDRGSPPLTADRPRDLRSMSGHVAQGQSRVRDPAPAQGRQRQQGRSAFSMEHAGGRTLLIRLPWAPLTAVPGLRRGGPSDDVDRSHSTNHEGARAGPPVDRRHGREGGQRRVRLGRPSVGEARRSANSTPRHVPCHPAVAIGDRIGHLLGCSEAWLMATLLNG